MDRRHLLPLALVVALVSAGCMGGFGGASSEETLCQDASYDMNTSAAETYTLRTNNSYQAVYQVEGNDRLELYTRNALGNDEPVTVRAVQFRAANGTTYDCEDIDVSTQQRRTVVELPAENGTFAYTSPSQPKRFHTRTVVAGPKEVVLPPNRSVSNFVFGSVRPGGYETSVDDENRLHVRWEEFDANTISVQYYLPRDITIFGALFVMLAASAGLVLFYYYRVFQRLKQRREEAGIDVEFEDDGDDPPPGMG
jgi:hypothetical protein